MHIWIIIILDFFLVLSLNGEPYFYPIATCQTLEGTCICYIYQQSPTELQLWLYDLTCHEFRQGLWSCYMPAGVRFCPSGTQFSFLDNGRIRVQSLLKRSARSFEFQEPLYEYGCAEWADDEHLYFSAKKRGHFGIFQTDMDNSVIPLIWDGMADYLYPQKVDQQLFVVKRSKENGDYLYSLVAVANKDGTVKVLIDFEKPITFLTMISTHEGFFASLLKRDEEKVSFAYYHIFCQGSHWQNIELFTFVLPMSLLVGPDRLYESILPLLPQYYKGIFYYTDCSSTDYLALYRYNMAGKQKKLIKSDQKHCFAPLLIENKLFYTDNEIQIQWLEEKA